MLIVFEWVGGFVLAFMVALLAMGVFTQPRHQRIEEDERCNG